MVEARHRCSFCGTAIRPVDLLEGRAVIVFQKRYCPSCMQSAILKGKARRSTPIVRQTLPVAAPPPVPVDVPSPSPVAVPAEVPDTLLTPVSSTWQSDTLIEVPREAAAPGPQPPASEAPPAPVPPPVQPEAPAEASATPAEAPAIPAAPRRTPIPPQATRRLKVGEHGCGFYSSEEDRRYQLGPYLRDGLEGGEKLLHFLRTPTPEKLLGDFRAAGLSPRPYLDSGQLEIVPVGKLIGPSGVFDPVKVSERILQAADRALEDGYTRLRIAGEMTWALGSQVDIGALVEYELRLTMLAVRGKCTSLCQYNVYRFDAMSLHEIWKNHPYVFAKGTAAMVIRELNPASRAPLPGTEATLPTPESSHS